MQNSTLSSYRIMVFVLLLSSASMLCESCSSVHVQAKQASKADDTESATVWALWWGASDPVQAVDCNGNGLQIVSMQTNWLYSLCSVVTLGAVVPVDIQYRCTSNPLQGGDELGSIDFNSNVLHHTTGGTLNNSSAGDE